MSRTQNGLLEQTGRIGAPAADTTDQLHFIVDYKVMESQKDPSQVAPLKERLQQKFKGKKITVIVLIKAFTVKTTCRPCNSQRRSDHA